MFKNGLIILGIMFTSSVFADVVKIVNVRLVQHASTWRADVTLKHDDKGWNDYADAWRLVDEDGKEIATRTLYHPHVNEQPFTRSLSDFFIPADKKVVIVEAHDKVNGWSPNKVKIDMGRSSGENYQIDRR